MAQILQGTTPKIKINLPSEIETNLIDDIELVFKSGETLVKHLSDIEMTNNSITYQFTQKETLEFQYNLSLRWQLRIKLISGEVLGTVINKINVSDLLSEEIL